MKKLNKIAACLLLAVAIAGCGAENDADETSVILARIGDKAITAEDFTRRAELAVRPPYCQNTTATDKRIILNSLIAEKLMALEAAKNDTLAGNENLRLYLQGRREQTMREVLFTNIALKKVHLDSSTLETAFRFAGRTYRVAYYTLADSLLAAQAAAAARTNPESFESLFDSDGAPGEVPQREIAWNTPAHDAVHSALFSGDPGMGQVIGPLQIATNRYALLKILDWRELPARTETEKQRRRREIIRDLQQRRAQQIYRQHVADIMRGKRLQFVPDTFRKLVEIVGPHYLKTFAERRKAIYRQFWQDSTYSEATNALRTDLDAIMDEPLLSVDGTTWSVGDFARHLKIHPLVFRKRDMAKTEFAEQYRLAIADMVQDLYVTREAYKKGYDRAPEVRRTEAMWRDNLYFVFQRNALLQTLARQGMADADELQHRFDAYVDSLQHAYSDRIEINPSPLDSIRITARGMFVVQQNVPFPTVVPSFPAITTKQRLDYGKILKK